VTISNDIRAAAASRILIKDGAYGTQIQAEKLVEADYRGDVPVTHDQKGNNDLLNLTRAEIVAGIARRFVAAGADILATNSFNATRISQADYGCDDVGTGQVEQVIVAALVAEQRDIAPIVRFGELFGLDQRAVSAVLDQNSLRSGRANVRGHGHERTPSRWQMA